MFIQYNHDCDFQTKCLFPFCCGSLLHLSVAVVTFNAHAKKKMPLHFKPVRTKITFQEFVSIWQNVPYFVDIWIIWITDHAGTLPPYTVHFVHI